MAAPAEEQVDQDLISSGFEHEDSTQPRPERLNQAHEQTRNGDNGEEARTSHGDDEEGEEEEEEDTEPLLKYTRLTGSLSSVYRKGDSTSSVLSTGDKLVCGTHNGNIHALDIPSLHTLRLYRAHSASVTAISTSPFTPVLSSNSATSASKFRHQAPSQTSSSKTTASPSTLNPRSGPAARGTEALYIATSSIDGHVCVSSLADPKDVILRNFARPVQAVALSPEYHKDRMFLSGGLAGNLILTTGGRPGASSKANTNGNSAAASSWLGSLGLSSSSGKDIILHSGEGSINTIAWSLSGKYVAWVNEKGIKIMRSCLGLDRNDSDLAWKRIAHIDHPSSKAWAGMSNVWKARAHWLDDRYLEDEDSANGSVSHHNSAGPIQHEASGSQRSSTYRTSGAFERSFSSVERLIVGWGDIIWVIDVRPGGLPDKRENPRQRSVGKALIIHRIVISDGIVSDLTLFTTRLLLLIVSRTRSDDEDSKVQEHDASSRKGIRRRRNALPPDLRLIDLRSSPEEEVDVTSLPFSKFESLSAGDYSVSTIYVPPKAASGPDQPTTYANPSVSGWGGAIWDAGRQSSRIFSSGASVFSGASSSTDREAQERILEESPPSDHALVSASPALLTSGLKIFVHSPYDCILASMRDASDGLKWHLEHKNFEEAWMLIDKNPSAVTHRIENESGLNTPTKPDGSLADFWEDSASSSTHETALAGYQPASRHEKRRVGNLWVQQLVAQNDWQGAARTAGKVIETSSQWEHWIWKFAEAGKFDEITPHIPARGLKPPLPSTVYELILAHYLETDIKVFQELLDVWDLSLFDIDSITKSLQAKLDSGEVSSSSSQDGVLGRDWRILLNSLARLYLEGSMPVKALNCYLQTKNADAVLHLVKNYRLLSAVADDVYSFVTVNVQENIINDKDATIEQLDTLSSDAIKLLAAGALQHLVSVSDVVQGLESKRPGSDPFLFFYFRTLWDGDIPDDLEDNKSLTQSLPLPRRKRFERDQTALAAKALTRALLSPYIRLAVSLFAKYSRPLLGDLLKYSDTSGIPLSEESGFYEHALAECERRNYIPELVSLLSATGQTRRALHLIIDQLGDVKQAIALAKDADDEELWQDLLDYSVDKPGFVKGLLMEGGASGDRLRPDDLVKRIPEGLDIPGLRDGLVTVLRDSDIQSSIAEGAAQIAQAEVAARLSELINSRKEGILLDVRAHSDSFEAQEEVDRLVKAAQNSNGKKCAICTEAIQSQITGDLLSSASRQDYLLVFHCGHVFHLECMLDHLTTPENAVKIGDLQLHLEEEDLSEISDNAIRHRTCAKMSRARMIGDVLGDVECSVCKQ